MCVNSFYNLYTAVEYLNTSLNACKEMYKPGIAIHCQRLSRLVDLSVVYTWTAALSDAASGSIWQQTIGAYAAWCTACVDLCPTRVKMKGESKSSRTCACTAHLSTAKLCCTYTSHVSGAAAPLTFSASSPRWSSGAVKVHHGIFTLWWTWW